MLALVLVLQPILHEYVEIRQAESTAPTAPRLVGPAAEGAVPIEVHQDGAEVHPPARASHEPDRQTEFKPDRDTAMLSTAGYEEPFSPSVAPFARGSAFDGVHADYTLYVRDRTLSPVPAGTRPTPDRTVFYGRVEVTFRRGEPIALPSPAPEVRIFGYEVARPDGKKGAQPRVEFFRDGADNLYARADFDGRRLLTFLVDAPRTYFQGAVPADAQLADEPARLAPELPPDAAKSADRVLAHLGVDRKTTVAAALDRLAAYFRSFENAPSDAKPSGDIYLDLALGQRGVCRHRAFAFVVTAQRLGLPARMVANDVHAFVEVMLPHVGWRRIDLGGAPMDAQSRMQAEAQKRPRAPADDPFPQPESYKRGSASSAVRATAHGAGDEPVLSEAPEGAPAPGAPPDPRAPTHVELDAPSAHDLRRGDTLDVSGRVEAEGTDAAGLTVDIYLRSMRATRSVWIATAVTDAQGRFRARGVVPRDAAGGDHQVIVRTRGDDRRAPSR